MWLWILGKKGVKCKPRKNLDLAYFDENDKF